MNPKPLNNTFDPKTLAEDLLDVRRIYAEFFATLDETRWDKPVKGGSKDLFLRMNTLFSVDAKPKVAANARISSTPQHLTGGLSK